MSRAFLILLLFLILPLRVFGNRNADERGGLIGADAPAGKRYVYKHSDGTPREMEIFFPPNHGPAKSRAAGTAAAGWAAGQETINLVHRMRRQRVRLGLA